MKAQRIAWRLMELHSMGNPGEHHLVPPGTSWFQAGTTWFQAGTSWFQVGTPWWYGENDKCQIFNKKKFPKF